MNMDRRDFLRLGGQTIFAGSGALALSGCQTLDGLSGSGLDLSGMLGSKGAGYADSALRIASVASQAAEQLDPEQEHYLGRTVAANVLTKFQTYDDPATNEYINTVGNFVRLSSRQPETFAGYRFQILDSDEINALSAPGGLIMITRGMLRCCDSEDALAAVLAHEVGHIEYRHGVNAIQRSRMTTLMTTIGGEAIRHRGSEQLVQLVSLLDGAINDVLQTMINTGYSRSAEAEADRAAVTILQRSGYDDRALPEMLLEMQKRLTPGARDFAHTHPAPSDRIRQIESQLRSRALPRNPTRQTRFERALRNV